MSEFTDRLQQCLVRLDLRGEDAAAVVGELLDALIGAQALAADDREAVLQAVLRREECLSTAVADGVAFPHVRTDVTAALFVPVIGIHRQGVAFGAPDGLPTRLFVLMVVTPAAAGTYMRMLAGFARQLDQAPVRERVLAAADPEAVRAALRS